jgi:hypothetical protein
VAADGSCTVLLNRNILDGFELLEPGAVAEIVIGAAFIFARPRPQPVMAAFKIAFHRHATRKPSPGPDISRTFDLGGPQMVCRRCTEKCRQRRKTIWRLRHIARNHNGQRP